MAPPTLVAVLVDGCRPAKGAFRDVCVPIAPDRAAFLSDCCVWDQGAAVPPTDGAWVRDDDQGACVCGDPESDVDGVYVGVLFGWWPACTELGNDDAEGSFSHAKSDPKGKCCITGNLDKTSASYILTRP